MCVAVGKRAGKVMDVILLFHTLFSCVGYITLIGDFTTKSMSGLAPNSIFATSRTAATLSIVVTTLFPLSLLRDLAPLKYTSLIGLWVIAFSCAYVFYDLFASAAEHKPMQNLTNNLWYCNFDHFKTIALFNGSFSAHYNAPTFYAELRQKSFRRYAKAALISFAISAVLFTTFGIAGFARFGNDVLGNVLKAYNPDHVCVQLSWMCMNIATIFVFPLAFQRMRASWTALVNKAIGLSSRSNVDFTTISLLAVSSYLGIAFTDIAVVKMIKGATLGVSIMFICPGIAYLGISANEDFDRQNSFGSDAENMKRQLSDSKEVMSSEPVAVLRALSYVLIATGILQGSFALLSYFGYV